MEKIVITLISLWFIGLVGLTKKNFFKLNDSAKIFNNYSFIQPKGHDLEEDDDGQL